MPKKSVLILQGILPDYRRPVFNRLSQFYDVTVAHSGPIGKREGDLFKEVILPVRRVGRFNLHRLGLIPALVAQHDATISMFDLAWPSYIFPVLFGKKRSNFFLWGHLYGASTLVNLIREWLMKRSKRVLMYGDHYNQRMVAAGIAPEQIVVAHNTMDISNHSNFSGCQKDSILFVGRLQTRKRVDAALEAFAKIVDKIPSGIMFDIVGDGPPRSEMEAQAAALGIAHRVRFHGAVLDDERLAGFFSKAIVYVSPSHVGLSVLHSFAYGVPVLCLRNCYHGPEFHNIHDGYNSIVADDEQEFTDKLLEIVNDRDLARFLGNNAYEHYSKRRTIDVMVSGFVKLVDG